MAGSSWPSILTSNNLRLWRLPFIEYSKDMDDIYKNIEEYNPSKKWKVLIVFDYMIAEVLGNKKLNPIVTELFIRGRKSNISLIFITHSCFAVPKDMRLNSIHYFVIKFQTKENFNKLHLIIHPILTFKTSWIFIKRLLQTHILFWLLILLFYQIILHVSDNSSRFRKNLLETI